MKNTFDHIASDCIDSAGARFTCVQRCRRTPTGIVAIATATFADGVLTRCIHEQTVSGTAFRRASFRFLRSSFPAF